MDFFKSNVLGIFILGVAASLVAAFLYDLLKYERVKSIRVPAGSNQSRLERFFKNDVIGIFILGVIASVVGTFFYEHSFFVKELILVVRSTEVSESEDAVALEQQRRLEIARPKGHSPEDKRSSTPGNLSTSQTLYERGLAAFGAKDYIQE